mgnify:CR=1 FL=1
MGDDSSFQKPYSDETNWAIDEEVRNVVKEQYQLTKDLLTKHKELISLSKQQSSQNHQKIQAPEQILSHQLREMTAVLEEFDEKYSRKEK